MKVVVDRDLCGLNLTDGALCDSALRVEGRSVVYGYLRAGSVVGVVGLGDPAVAAHHPEHRRI